MRFSSWRARLGLALAGLAIVIAGAYLAINHAVDLEVEGRLHDRVEAVPAADLALVPAAEVYGNGRPSPALASRLDGAIDLYRAGRVTRLLMSGGNGRTEVEAMLAYATVRGVPGAAISLDPTGERTLDSCRTTRAATRGPVVIVTQAEHLRRAVFTCRQLGVDAQGLIVPDFTGDKVLIYHVREQFALVLAWWETVVLGKR